LGAIIGNAIVVVPYIIKRVSIVKAVIVIVRGILRHAPLFIASNVQKEEVLYKI